MTILLVAAGVGLGPGALAVWAQPNPPFDGHGHDRHDKNSRDGGHDRREHRDHGRHRHRGWERDRQGFYRFDGYDRREVSRYYREHRRERWFRELGPRGVALICGRVLAPRCCRYCRPLPPVMLHEMLPPPPHCRYFPLCRDCCPGQRRLPRAGLHPAELQYQALRRLRRAPVFSVLFGFRGRCLYRKLFGVRGRRAMRMAGPLLDWFT